MNLPLRSTAGSTISKLQETLLKPHEAPPRVLHIVENLNRGAVENWLIRMLRYAKRKGVAVDWTFYCVLPQPGALDDEALELGARIVRSRFPIGKTVSFVNALRSELRRSQYDVLHCHHDLLSAIYLLAAAGLPIGRRIVHVHNADEGIPTPSLLKRWLYREPMRHVCLSLADHIVGISNHTLDTFLAGRPRRPVRDVVHYYGVEPTILQNSATDRVKFRQQLGLPDDTLVLLFGGRLVPEKNPIFAVNVLESLRRIEPRAALVYVGAGTQEQAILARARELGVPNWTRMLGWRTDLPQIMNYGDWFILPRPEIPLEGFGLAVVEAQLAGLRMLLSLGIPNDPLLPTAIFRRLALDAGPKKWAKAAVELMNQPLPTNAQVVAALATSQMDMDIALHGLLGLHA